MCSLQLDGWKLSGETSSLCARPISSTGTLGLLLSFLGLRLVDNVPTARGTVLLTPLPRPVIEGATQDSSAWQDVALNERQ